MKLKIKKGALQFFIRLAVFAALFYGVLPWALSSISQFMGLEMLVKFSGEKSMLFSIIVLVGFVIYEREKILNLERYRQGIMQTTLFGVLFLLSTTVHFLFAYVINLLPPNMIGINFAGIYGSYFTSAILLFVAVFNVGFIKKFYKSLVALTAILGIFFGLTLILRGSWTILSWGIATISYHLLNLFYGDNNLIFDSRGYPSLSSGSFSAGIGAPCSGIDSLSMFISLFLLVMVLDWKKLNIKKASILFVIGAIGMYLVSVLRIVVLMIVGRYNRELSMGLFHDNAGWIIFVVYMMIFLYLGYPWMKKGKVYKASETHES